MQKALIYTTLFLLVTTSSHSLTSRANFASQDVFKLKLPIEFKAENEFAVVQYSFIGCFGRDNYEILLYEKGGINYAGIKKNQIIMLESRINQSQIDSFDIFVNELKSLSNNGYCTTVEYYRVTYKNETFYQSNEDCSWNGFTNLKKTLFVIYH